MVYMLHVLCADSSLTVFSIECHVCLAVVISICSLERSNKTLSVIPRKIEMMLKKISLVL
jgi:hypothetical protein